jgi:DNA topoisomerase-2
MLSRFSSHRLRAASKDAVNRISKNRRPAISSHFRRHEIWHSTPLLSSIQEIQFRSFSSVLVDDDNGKTIEEQYSKKTPLEHVLLRPGMYVGPVERLPPNRCWVLEPTPKPAPQSLPTSAENVATPAYRMVHKEYGLIPALIKIFDEILVNASDNRLRSPKSCTRLDVIIDPGSKDRDPFISIRNDGKGIPIQIHKEENMYVPEMLFGHLLTGSNFDDNEKRLTGE